MQVQNELTQKCGWLFCVLAILAMAVGVGAEPLRITRSGKTKAVILLPIAPDKNETLAAQELSLYLRKITGAEFPIISVHQQTENDAFPFDGPVFSVGRTPLAGQINARENWPKLSHQQAYRIKRSDRVVVIEGNADSGLGSYGTLYGVYGFLEHLGVRWFLPGELGERVPKQRDLTIDQLDLTSQPTMDSRKAFNFGNDPEQFVWARRNKWEGVDIVSGHNFFEQGETLWPANKTREEHPDWFFGPAKPCLTNPGLRARFIERATQNFKDSPGRYCFSLSLFDGGMDQCPCENCKVLWQVSMTDLVLDFYNSVSDEIASRFPGKVCAGLAYENYLAPPKKIKVSKNFIPVLASFSEDSPASEERVMGWKNAGGRIFIYSYEMGDPPHPNLTAKRFAAYRRWGAMGVCIERRPTEAISGLNYWMEHRLMWNWDLDAEKLVDEFCMGLFGPKAGPVMKSFFYGVEKKTSEFSLEDRQAALQQAAELAGPADSKESQCVRVFQLGETMVRCKAMMQKAAKQKDWKVAADLADQGVAAYDELRSRYPLYYVWSGDEIGAPHVKLVAMAPLYRATADYTPPEVSKSNNGRGLCLTNNNTVPAEQRFNSGVTVEYDIPPNPSEAQTDGPPYEGQRLFNEDPDKNWRNDSVGMFIYKPAAKWNITLDLKNNFEVTQVDVTVGIQNTSKVPYFIDVSVGSDKEHLLLVDRIDPRGQGGRDTYHHTRLFSREGRYVRLCLLDGGNWAEGSQFDIGEVRVWGHPK